MESLTIFESEVSLSNLEEIANYTQAKQLDLGRRFVKYYYEQIAFLRSMPNIRCCGKVFGTREFILQESPYFVVYRVRKNTVQILRVFHQMRCYP